MSGWNEDKGEKEMRHHMIDCDDQEHDSADYPIFRLVSNKVVSFAHLLIANCDG